MVNKKQSWINHNSKLRELAGLVVADQMYFKITVNDMDYLCYSIGSYLKSEFSGRNTDRIEIPLLIGKLDGNLIVKLEESDLKLRNEKYELDFSFLDNHIYKRTIRNLQDCGFDTTNLVPRFDISEELDLPLLEQYLT